MKRHLLSFFALWAAATALVAAQPATSQAEELLVADRLTNRILRYSPSGSFIGVLTDDTSYLSEPNGMAVTGSTLWVANRQSSSVFGFRYDGVSATNPSIAITTGNLNVPASILIDENAESPRIYVSNLGATFSSDVVSQFTLDGSTLDDLTGGGATGRTGMAFAPDGSILVGSFGDQATGEGQILKFNTETQVFETFIGPSQALFGAGNLVVDGNSLYVAAGFAGGVFKYDATTGEPDPTFTPIMGLEFPASLTLAPGGDELLVGILGFVNGTGRIDRYSLDGELLGTFASAQQDPSQGFFEATGMLVVSPDFTVVGDADNDGDVDLTDLNLVRNHFGATGADDGSLDGDAYPFNGVVDLEDLNAVRNNFGGTATVPEPSSVALGLVGLAMAGAIAKRRRS
jgi:hypothetical protein